MGARIIMYLILLLLAAFAVVGISVILLILFAVKDDAEDTEIENFNNKSE